MLHFEIQLKNRFIGIRELDLDKITSSDQKFLLRKILIGTN